MTEASIPRWAGFLIVATIVSFIIALVAVGIATTQGTAPSVPELLFVWASSTPVILLIEVGGYYSA